MLVEAPADEIVVFNFRLHSNRGFYVDLSCLCLGRSGLLQVSHWVSRTGIQDARQENEIALRGSYLNGLASLNGHGCLAFVFLFFFFSMHWTHVGGKEANELQNGN
jgi:hypothetical protein